MNESRKCSKFPKIRKILGNKVLGLKINIITLNLIHYLFSTSQPFSDVILWKGNEKNDTN